MNPASRFIQAIFFAIVLLPHAATDAFAACGLPASAGASPTATDALHILNSAVGTADCTLALCDVTGDCVVSASDALTTLLAAIGRDIELDCSAACPTQTACGDATAPTCNGTCPYASACSAAGGTLPPDPRVTVCHGDPPLTVTVSLEDLDAHVAHGDRMRRCEDLAPAEPPLGRTPFIAGSGDVAACSCVPVEVPTTTSTTTTTTTTSTSTSVTLPDPPANDPDNDGLVGAADPCPTQPLNQCFGQTAVDTGVGLPIRINADAIGFHSCSGNRIDCTGRIWLNDFGYNKMSTGAVCDINIGGAGCSIRNIESIFGCTSQFTEHLFLCEHFDREPEPDLHYSFTVPNGRYLINFLFANTFKETRTVGTRIFDIAAEGLIVLDDFDQVAVAGASRTALVRSVIVEVTDGNGLQIEFGHVVENPAIKGIEILAESLR